MANVSGEREKLQRIRDWLKFNANSAGGIVDEIDFILEDRPSRESAGSDTTSALIGESSVSPAAGGEPQRCARTGGDRCEVDTFERPRCKGCERRKWAGVRKAYEAAYEGNARSDATAGHFIEPELRALVQAVKDAAIESHGQQMLQEIQATQDEGGGDDV